MNSGALVLVMDMVWRTRPLVQKARAEQHGDGYAKDPVVPHLVPP
jgi:hypothetical protein